MIHYSMLRFGLFISIIHFALMTSVLCAAEEKQDPFVGEFIGYADGDQYSLTLTKADKESYLGVILVDGENYVLKGKRDGSKITGTADKFGDAYGFEMTLQKDGSLVFKDENGRRVIFRSGTAATDRDHIAGS